MASKKKATRAAEIDKDVRIKSTRKGSVVTTEVKLVGKSRKTGDLRDLGKTKVSRSAETGRLVSAKVTAANPSTTVTETVVRKPKKGERKIPKSLAEAVDLYKTVRDERLAIQKSTEDLAEFERKLKQHIIDTLPKSQAGGITGKLARAEITKRNIPVVEDDKKFFAYAHRKGNEDLVKETMVQAAVQARWDAGKSVPGIGTFTVVNLSLTTVKK